MQRTLKTFQDWASEVKAFSSPDCTLPLLGVYGTKGLAKTYTLESVLGDRARTIRCHGTPIELVRAIYEANESNQIPLLDDIDSLLKDVKTLNILKGGVDAGGRIQWSSNTKLLPPEMKDFRVHVKVAVISNDPLVFTRHLRAVEDRGVVYNLAPDAYEVHRNVGQWWPGMTEPSCRDDAKKGRVELCPAYDDEVYQHLGSILDLVSTPTVRAYTISARMRQAGMNWKAAVEDTFCLDQEHQLVRHLMLNPAFTAEDRVCEFIKKVTKSRATYYRHQDEITKRLGIKPVATDDKLRRERMVALQKQYVPPGFETQAADPIPSTPDESKIEKDRSGRRASPPISGDDHGTGSRIEIPGLASSRKNGRKKSG